MHIYVYMYVCVCVCLSICTYVEIHVGYTYMRIYICIHRDPLSFFQAGTAQLQTIEEEKQKAYTALTTAAAAAAAEAAAAACSFCECVSEERNREGDEEGEKYDIMAYGRF